MRYKEIIYGIRNINNYLSTWLQNNGFEDCRAYYDFEFSYDFANNFITYNFEEPTKDDLLYVNICKNCNDRIISCDNFILSLFHEIGHLVYSDRLSDDEWEAYETYIQEIKNREIITDDDIIAYYMSDVEYNATIWGCNYIVENKDKIKELIDGLKIISPSYYNWEEFIISD